MPRRKKGGLGPGTRGRHKKHRSRETRAWLRLIRRGSKVLELPNEEEQ